MNKREIIQSHADDKRDARRDEKEQFTDDQVNVGKSLPADPRTKAKTIVPKGQAAMATRRNVSCDARAAASAPAFHPSPPE